MLLLGFVGVPNAVAAPIAAEGIFESEERGAYG